MAGSARAGPGARGPKPSTCGCTCRSRSRFFMCRRHVLGRTGVYICRLCKRKRILHGSRQVDKLLAGGRLVLGWRDGQLRSGTREVDFD